MKRTVAALAVLGAGMAVMSPAQAAAAKKNPADLVLWHGSIQTITGKAPAHAVAVRHGKVVYVGTDRGARRFVGKRTRVVNLRGRTVMPGITDGHIHLVPELPVCDLEHAALTVTGTQKAVQACLDATKGKEPDGWLQVNNWNLQEMKPAGTVPTKQMLDGLTTKRPIYIFSDDGHNAWVNSRALELAKITKDTPNPQGGEIVRDAQGEPTGYLKETAMELVARLIPQAPLMERVAGLRKTLKRVTAAGLTSYAPQLLTEDDLKAWKYLADRHEIPGRAVGSLALDATEAGKDIPGTVRHLNALRRKYAGPNFKIASIGEVFADGVIEYPAQTARLLKPYLVKKNGKWVPGPSRGPLRVKQDTLNKVTAALDKAGWQVQVHAIGDGAARQALNAFYYSRTKNGKTGRRHVISHAQLVDPSDYARFKRLDVTASMALQWAQKDPYTMDALKNFLGTERWKRQYPARSLLKAGGNISNGSDYPVDPLNPMRQLEAAVTRTAESTGGNPKYEGPLGPQERLTLAQSLRVHTLNGAYQLHQEKLVGSIQVGKRADFIILSRNLTRIPITGISKIKAKATVIDGRLVAGTYR